MEVGIYSGRFVVRRVWWAVRRDVMAVSRFHPRAGWVAGVLLQLTGGGRDQSLKHSVVLGCARCLPVLTRHQQQHQALKHSTTVERGGVPFPAPGLTEIPVATQGHRAEDAPPWHWLSFTASHRPPFSIPQRWPEPGCIMAPFPPTTVCDASDQD